MKVGSIRHARFRPPRLVSVVVAMARSATKTRAICLGVACVAFTDVSVRAMSTSTSPLSLTILQQYMPSFGREEWLSNHTAVQWDPAETALVVIDMSVERSRSPACSHALATCMAIHLFSMNCSLLCMCSTVPV